MKKPRKPIGYYVVNAKREQLAWASTRATARKLAAKISRENPTECPVWTVAEYAEAA